MQDWTESPVAGFKRELRVEWAEFANVGSGGMVSRVLALGVWVNECWGHLLAQKNLCR